MSEFIHAKLPANPSKTDIQNEIDRLKGLSAQYRNDDFGLKVIINSVYGVLGFTKFALYHIRIAEAITTQSRDVIQYTGDRMNDYFKNKWHLDTDIHVAMGITNVRRVSQDVINYIDTDSVFIVLDEVYEKCDYDGDFTDFMLDLDKCLFRDFNNKIMHEYCTRYNGFTHRRNGDPSMNLELEQILHAALFVRKKKYIKDVSWDSGSKFDALSNTKYKGIEINQSSTPNWVRSRLKEVVHYILSVDKIDGKSLNDWIKINIKPKFDVTDVENICRSERVGGYNKFIIDDNAKFEVGPNCKPHTRGAGFHNWLLNNSKWGTKYDLIGDSEKVMYYYTKDHRCKNFAFIQGEYPVEIAPEIDRDQQFEKMILGPINNIIESMGIVPLKPQLIKPRSIF